MSRYLRAVVPCLMLATGALLAQGTVEEVHPLSPGGEIEVEIIAGSVEVRGWDRNEIKIFARLGKGTEGLEIDQDEDSISIEVVLRSGRDVGGTELVLQVPNGVELEVESISAPIDVSDLSGSLYLESISGRIQVLSGEFDEVELGTVSGTVEVEHGVRIREGSFESVSGTLRIRAELDDDGEFDLETVSGSILLEVGGLCADFDVETFSGSIDNEIGPRARKTSPYIPSQEVSFSTCDGGASVSISSFSGRIRIRE